ncbi:MAG TPA: secondary thiamine-phosphate synthase enzyme YjbQ [Methylomirabilota bacterium]|nr:secondary thiamine-phosphate synthase enzyme YjbQ [Methylomirabilota bacterium]
MKQSVDQITVSTRGRAFHEITSQVEGFVRAAQIQTGLVTLHLQHTSASLLIQENADPEVRRDFERFFSRLIPDGDPLLEHDAEGPDDMPAHIRTALTAVNLSIPVVRGSMTLGTWQGIYLWEQRTHTHSRKVTLHIIGE